MKFTSTIVSLSAVAGTAMALPAPQEAAMKGDGQWTVSNFVRKCTGNSCTFDFSFSEGVSGFDCSFTNDGNEQANFSGKTCTNVKSDITIGAGYSTQFGTTPDKAFTVFNIVQSNQIIYPSWTEAVLESGVAPAFTAAPQALPGGSQSAAPAQPATSAAPAAAQSSAPAPSPVQPSPKPAAVPSAAPSPAAPTKTGQWTVSNFKGVYTAGKASYSFHLDAAQSLDCSFSVDGDVTTSFSGKQCGAATVSGGYSAQFGADKAFVTFTIVEGTQIIYPAFPVAQLQGSANAPLSTSLPVQST